MNNDKHTRTHKHARQSFGMHPLNDKRAEFQMRLFDIDFLEMGLASNGCDEMLLAVQCKVQ